MLRFHRFQCSESHLFLNPLANGNIPPHFPAPGFSPSGCSVPVDLFPFPHGIFVYPNKQNCEGLSREHLEFPAQEMPGRGKNPEYAKGARQTRGQKADIIHFANGQLFGCGCPLLPWIVMQIEGLRKAAGPRLGWALGQEPAPALLLWDQSGLLPAERLPWAPAQNSGCLGEE